jgi:murein DD-endopeptidase MepM/ murein hydrolase activator NlpD
VIRRRRKQQRRLQGAALPFALTVLGILVLGLAFVPLRLPSSGSEQVATPGVLPPVTDADFEHREASVPRRAAATSAASPPAGAIEQQPPPASTVAPPPTPRPVMRAPVPVGARPVTQAGAVAGGSQTWIAQVAARTTEQLEVAVVSQSPALDAVASAVAALLTQKQINAYQARMADVRRPDVILLLDQSGGGASVWYCSPSQSASATLASTLLADVASYGIEEGAGDVTSTMSCDSLHLGRASSAAALVRLPTRAPDAPQQLVSAVSRYLDENAAAIRRGRQTLRMAWPAIGPITSHYGPDHPLGIDIGQSTGAILAATDGTVIFAGGDACCSYGLFVVITGPRDITMVYGHLETLAVKVGDTVRLGQPVGEVGCTGHCFGTHLHFEVIKDGLRQNPMDYLP